MHAMVTETAETEARLQPLILRLTPNFRFSRLEIVEKYRNFLSKFDEHIIPIFGKTAIPGTPSFPTSDDHDCTIVWQSPYDSCSGRKSKIDGEAKLTSQDEEGNFQVRSFHLFVHFLANTWEVSYMHVAKFILAKVCVTDVVAITSSQPEQREQILEYLSNDMFRANSLLPPEFVTATNELNAAMMKGVDSFIFGTQTLAVVESNQIEKSERLMHQSEMFSMIHPGHYLHRRPNDDAINAMTLDELNEISNAGQDKKENMKRGIMQLKQHFDSFMKYSTL